MYSTVSFSEVRSECNVCEVAAYIIRFMACSVAYHTLSCDPQLTLDSHSLVFPCCITVGTHVFYPSAAMSCPLARNCFLALLHIYHLLKHHLLSSGFIAHAKTVFALDSDSVKLVVEEVKNQLFEGTSKWPMAADS